MFVFLNSRFVRASAAKVSVFDPGFQHGEGLFETLLVKQGEAELITPHLKRLRAGARVLGMRVPLADADLRKVITKLIVKNKMKTGMLRITLTPETLLLTTRPIPKRPATAAVTCVPMERVLPQLKTLNYLPSVFAQRVATAGGFDEALLVNRDGFVTEGARTNLFWTRRGRLYTSPLGDALAGVTRDRVMQLAKKCIIACTEKKVRPADLAKADELFLTNAPMGIWPIVRFEKKKLAVGTITQQLQAAYLKKHA